nr:PASTA domain-containing protein [Prevotella sp.]
MTTKDFIKKFKSKYLWNNIAAMFGVVVLLCLGVKFGMDIYTHHGESIPIPNILHKNFDDAERILDDAGLKIVLTDTGYVKSLPPDCVLEQSPGPGERVKSGHIIYVTINSNHSPMVTIPDVIDNSSLREAMAKLTAMGFKLGQPQFVSGEQDWVYGILVKGKHVSAGDKVSIEETLIIQVGNGQRSSSDSVNYVEPEMNEDDEMEEVPEKASPADKDEFQEIKDDGGTHGE